MYNINNLYIIQFGILFINLILNKINYIDYQNYNKITYNIQEDNFIDEVSMIFLL